MKSHGIGRFVSKPVLKTRGEVPFSEFTLVFEEKRKSKTTGTIKHSHYFTCVIWDKAAEMVVNTFDKGDVINIIQATPRQETWEDNDTKEKRSRVVFRIDDFGFVPRPSREAEERLREKYSHNEDLQEVD